MPPTYNPQFKAFSVTQRMKMLKDVVILKDAGVPEDVVRSTMGDFGDIVDSVYGTTKKATAPGEGQVQRDEEEEEMVEEQMVQE